MNIWKLSIRNFRYKPLYTLLSILMLSISLALLFAMQQLDQSFKLQLENNLGTIDMVVGAKGSPLQLVLASVLHIDNPTGNIPYKEAKKIAKNPMVKKAVPISYGDNYMGYRIVGTTNGFAELYGGSLSQGRAADKSMEVVLGSTVAERSGLGIGDTFLSSHGLAEEGGHEHAHPLTIVGIYKPTYQVLDRLMTTPLETIWDVHDHHGEDDREEHDRSEDGHDHEHHHEEDGHDHGEEDHGNEDDKEITSLLVSFRSPTALLTLPRNINENTGMQAALPKFELDRLYQFTGIGFKAITWIAYVILAISCITIFISFYRMVRDRAFDLALLRTYGSNTLQLVQMVAYEGLLIVVLSFFFGMLISRAALAVLSNMVERQYKQRIPLETDYAQLLQTGGLVVAIVLLSIIFAIYPIMRMNISKILSREK